MARPPIDPVRRSVPKAPARANRRRGDIPFPPARVIPLSGKGPEDVVVDRDGLLLTGLEDGRVLRVDPESGSEELLCDTGGRPLGLELLDNGRVLVCDSHKGLLRLDPASGDFETLVESVEGKRLRFCSNAAIQSDGTIWFSESSDRFHFEHYVGAILEQRAAGRIFRMDPDGTVEVAVRDLYFANGITLTKDESALLFAETGDYRISRLSLQGPRAGEVETLVENLPAFPDNMSRMSSGRTWIALPNARDRRLDALADRSPILRKMVWAVPDRLKHARRTTWVMAIDEKGEIVADLQEPRPDFHMVTGAAEHDDKLYLSSIAEPALLEVDLASVASLANS